MSDTIIDLLHFTFFTYCKTARP